MKKQYLTISFILIFSFVIIYFLNADQTKVDFGNTTQINLGRIETCTSASITQNLGVINKMIIGSDTIDDLPSVTNLRIIASGASAYAFDIYNPSTLTDYSSRLTLRTGKTDKYYSGVELDVYNIDEDPGIRGLLQCNRRVGENVYPFDFCLYGRYFGIGTTNPQAKLHVEGDILANSYNFTNSTYIEVYQNGGSESPNEQFAQASFTTEVYDTLNEFANSQWTVTATGTYFIDVQVIWASGNAGRRIIEIIKNGNSFTSRRMSEIYVSGSDIYPTHNISTILYNLSPGDVISVGQQQTSGANLGFSSGSAYSHIIIRRLQ